MTAIVILNNIKILERKFENYLGMPAELREQIRTYLDDEGIKFTSIEIAFV